MSVDKQQAFIERLAEALEVPPQKVTPDYVLDESNWDSLAHMSAIAIIDDEYGITVPASELVNCRSVNELLELVHRRAANDLT